MRFCTHKYPETAPASNTVTIAAPHQLCAGTDGGDRKKTITNQPLSPQIHDGVYEGGRVGGEHGPLVSSAQHEL